MISRVTKIMCIGLFAFGTMQVQAADAPGAKGEAEAHFKAVKKQLDDEHEANKASCNGNTSSAKRVCRTNAKEKYQQALSAAKADRDKALANTK